MTEIKLYKSSWKGIKLIALSLPFVIIGIWVICNEQKGTFDYVMGWFSASFFGLGMLIGFFILFDRRPQIIINEDGIFDSTLKQGEIKWEQIVEVYPIDIQNQKFIALVFDENFEFDKKHYEWVEKLNEFVGAQKLNLNLSQIKVDEIKLSELLNKIIDSDKRERQNHIRLFSSNQKLIPNFEIQNYLIYFLLLIVLVIISLSSYIAFMTIIIIMGIAALISKWYQGTNNNSAVHKYAKIMTFLGFTHMVILLLIIKTYEFSSNRIGVVISNQIEIYKSKHGNLPNDIEDIKEELNLNPIENYIATKIEYEKNGNEYNLKLETLNHHQTEFDKELKEWY